MRCALCLLVYCLMGVMVAHAQPPDADPPARVFIEPRLDPLVEKLLDPYSIISQFTGYYAANHWDRLPDFVQGAKNNPAIEEVGKELLKARGTMRLTVTDITPQIDGDDAIVNFFVHANDHLGATMVWRESLHLHQEDYLWKDEKGAPRKNSVWRIVPSAKRLIHTDDALGFFNRIATYVAYADELPSLLKQRQAGVQASQIALALTQYAQDNKEVLDFTEANFKEKIAIYLRSIDVLTAPGDEAAKQSFSFNGKMSNLNIADKIGELDKLVIFYLGRDGKPEFRFGGKTIVGFADNHIEFVDEAKSKTLRWEP